MDVIVNRAVVESRRRPAGVFTTITLSLSDGTVETYDGFGDVVGEIVGRPVVVVRRLFDALKLRRARTRSIDIVETRK